MTLSQAIDYVRNRHNAASDSNWSNTEIYALITARCNEILSIIGLIEAVDTSITTTAGTDTYAYPTNVEFIKKVLYDGYPVTLISLNQLEIEKNGNTTPSGRPFYYALWNRSLIFTPIPNEIKTVTLYAEKQHPFIDGASQTTIDIPSILHARMLDGVIADMFAKDLNQGMLAHYENKWNGVHMRAFYDYKMQLKYRGRSPTVVDCDTEIGTDYGVV